MAEQAEIYLSDRPHRPLDELARAKHGGGAGTPPACTAPHRDVVGVGELAPLPPRQDQLYKGPAMAPVDERTQAIRHHFTIQDKMSHAPGGGRRNMNTTVSLSDRGPNFRLRDSASIAIISFQITDSRRNEVVGADDASSARKFRRSGSRT